MSTANSKIQWTNKTWNPVRGCSMAKGSETGTLPSETGFLRCPSPAELTEIARTVPVLPPAPSGMVPADPGCPHCKGVGWTITRKEISGYGVVEGAKECECRKVVSA